MEAYIPVLKGYYPLFSFPEFNTHRQQIEQCTLDYTHLLTNLCCQICRKGLENMPKSTFVCVCKEHPEIISHALVIDIIDKQSSEFALKLFSPSVEEQLVKNGENEAALFVCLVYNWHKACDKCGMPADERVNNLWAFYCYLVKDVSFNRFPAPGMYIKGIPIITYCGILQNCCTHICLYNI